MANQKEKATNPKDKIGAKKPDLSLLPTGALVECAKAMMNGAVKYGPFNWRDPNNKPGYMTYIAANQRHMIQFLDGENYARDSMVHHLAHAICTNMVLLDAILCGNAIDDRPHKGPAPDMIEDYFKEQTTRNEETQTENISKKERGTGGFGSTGQY